MVVHAADGVFSYRVPPEFAERAAVGMRALVSFGRRRVTGVIVDLGSRDPKSATKSIDCLLEPEPVFDSGMLRFTRWMADYYLCSWGDVLKAALPAGITLDEKAHWVLEQDPDPAQWRLFFESYPRAARLVQILRARPISPAGLKSRHGLSLRSVEIRQLKQAGVISLRPILKAPRVRSKMDALLTLSEPAQTAYGSELFTQIRTLNAQRLLREIFESGPDGAMRSQLLRGANSARRSALGKLIADGHVVSTVQEVSRWEPAADVVPEPAVSIQLTPEQNRALSALREAAESRTFQPFLLHGVTGSGKTQVYIEAIRHVLEQNRTALVLVPEIALTPFLWSRFRHAFGERVAIQHSGQSPSVRYDLWRGIQAGRYPVVVGARSAVFAPLKNLGIVVVDEEQETSFKQTESAPRYHARDAAMVRARMDSAVAVLGSATPSIESYHHALQGRYKLLELPERVGGAIMPEIRIEHIESERRAPSAETDAKGGEEEEEAQGPPILTQPLREQLHRTLARGRQAILLQNRRGFAPFVVCKTCGHIARCEQCSVSLTYHRRGRILRCHYCDHREDAGDVCPQCGSTDLVLYGVGTQRLEEELAVEFPEARVLRMDSDSVARPGAHARMIRAFAAHDYDILIGTQMIAKGLDFPGVELAAVVQADTELFHPDFRATERGASLILQLAGRAGRRTEPGRVVVQTATVDHPALSVVASGRWRDLVEEELDNRKRAAFPPFARLVLLRAVGSDESDVAKTMLRLKNLLREYSPVDLLGPAPAVVARVRSRIRYQLLARTSRAIDPSGKLLRNSVRTAVADYHQSRTNRSVTLEIDVDPMSIL